MSLNHLRVLTLILFLFSIAGVGETRNFDAEKRFSIEIPSGWEIQRDVMGASLLGISPQEGKSDSFRENVNVVVEQLASPLSGSEYFEASQNVLKKVFTNYKLEKSGKSTIDRHDFFWTLFTHQMNKIHAKVIQYSSVDGKNAYVITCSSTPKNFDRFKKTFEKSILSFQFSKPEVVKK